MTPGPQIEISVKIISTPFCICSFYCINLISKRKLRSITAEKLATSSYQYSGILENKNEMTEMTMQMKTDA